MRKYLLSALKTAPVLLLLAISLVADGQAVRPIAQGTLTVGQAAPNFTLVAQDGSSVSLSSLRGQWVVLFFYPSATDADSIAELKSFENDLSNYDRYGTVIGVSTMPAAQQAQLAASAGVTFPLLSDPQGKTAQGYRSLANTGVVIRNTFAIDPQGDIAQVWAGVPPSTVSSSVKLFFSLKPPVGTASPMRMSLKPPVP